MKIWFDMDGTIADLYGVENWLDYLTAEDVKPYFEAKPMLHLSTLARLLNELQRKGYEIGVISWLSRSSSAGYNAKVTAMKYGWLARHLPSVDFDEIHIIPYGTPKQNYATEHDILFDDEQGNREAWTGIAYDMDNILGVLKNLLKTP